MLRVRTNLVLIAASACGYYFLAGIQTFGSEFAKEQYRINQAFANILLLLVGIGAVVGVLAGGFLGDWLVRKRYLKGRILVSVIAATGATVLFVPALFARTAWGALPYLALAAMALSAQNPPLDAARLDIMPAQLWGRAEAIRTVLRGVAQALAPLLFGLVSDYVFGGGRVGLQLTFVVMLLPLGGKRRAALPRARHVPARRRVRGGLGRRGRRVELGRSSVMGTWGVGLYQCDDAADLRVDVREVVRAPWDGDRLLAWALDAYPELTDPRHDGHTDLRLALADVFWSYGIEQAESATLRSRSSTTAPTSSRSDGSGCRIATSSGAPPSSTSSRRSGAARTRSHVTAGC